MKQWLKQSGFLSSTLLILGALFLMQSALGLVGRGSVLVPHVVDGGIVKSGDAVPFRIVCINRTPLLIKVFSEAGCSCSVVDKPSGTLFPFGSFNTKVEVKTAALPPGRHSKPTKLTFIYSNRTWEEQVDLAFQIQ